jgi:hypothetical protein
MRDKINYIRVIISNVKMLACLLFCFLSLSMANAQIPKGEVAGAELIQFKWECKINCVS